MSIFNSIFGSNKEKLEKEKKEKEELERLEKEKKEKEELEKLEKEKKEKEELERLEKEKKEKYLSLISDLDKDNDGILDLVQVDDFTKILKKHQEKIIEINRDYIQQFVQVSNYLKTKRKSILTVYDKIRDTISQGGTKVFLYDILKNTEFKLKVELFKKVVKLTGIGVRESMDIVDEFTKKGSLSKESNILCIVPLDELKVKGYFELIKDDIHLYNVLMVYSLNMIESLVNNNMISFYEIYERFDELNMFDKKHERDLISQLNNLNEGLEDIMKQIELMGQEIVSSIGDLSMITEESTQMINEGLRSVESSINTNNLISSIQTYQIYKVNKNTKSLR